MRARGDIKWFSFLKCCMSRGQRLSGSVEGPTAGGLELPSPIVWNVLSFETQPLTVSCTTDLTCMPLAPCVCSPCFIFSFAIDY